MRSCEETEVILIKKLSKPHKSKTRNGFILVGLFQYKGINNEME